jgi:hypothetical protein
MQSRHLWQFSRWQCIENEEGKQPKKSSEKRGKKWSRDFPLAQLSQMLVISPL